MAQLDDRISSALQHCSRNGTHTAATLSMAPLATKRGQSHCGATACLFEDTNQLLVMKQYLGPNLMHGGLMQTKYRVLDREACILKALQPFAWAPRLLCIGRDYILMTRQGRPFCAEELPKDYRTQVHSIVTDMQSVGIRQNDMVKEGLSDLVKMNGTVSLVDFTWATANGSLAIKCTFQGTHLSAPDSRPRSEWLDIGLANKDENVHSLGRCRPKDKPQMMDARLSTSRLGTSHMSTRRLGTPHTGIPRPSTSPLKTSSRGFASTNQASETSGQRGGLRMHNLSSLTQESAPAHLKTWGELIKSKRDDVDCTSFPASARPWCRQLQASHFGCRAKLLDTWRAPRAAATTPYMFEKVYVVHYTKRPWRKLRMLDRLQGVGINTSDAAGVVSFVDAFDRETISTSILHCFNCAAVIDRQSGLPKPPGDKQTTGQCSAHIKHFVARLDMIRLLYEPYLSPVP